MRVLLIIICCLLLVTGCINKSSNNNEPNNSNTIVNESKESDVKVSEIKVTINDINYILKLENNETVKEFLNILPKEFTMNDLNNNEKYINMDKSLTTNSSNPKHIEKGDVMLYGSDCLVIFYKSFDTQFSYTKIGHIDGLLDLGNDSIKAKFEI